MNLKLKITEMQRLSVEEFRESRKLPVVVVLDNVRSLYNVGSVFRTCDAFRVEEITICGITACPPNIEIHKTAIGAEFAVRWRYFKDTEEAVNVLRSEGCRLYSVEQCHRSILPNQAVSESKGCKVALVFGHEVKGVQQSVVDLSDGCIEIPQAGTKHSMNVSVAVGVVVWEFFKEFLPQLADKSAR